MIICGNDVVALGALNAAKDLGVSVPDEVSMVGFDDLPAAAWPLIQLTTVAFDLDAMARKAASLLVRRVEAEEPEPYEHAVFSTSLVRRGTLGAAP